MSQIHMIVVSAMIVSWSSIVALADDSARIRPYEANPFYRQYKDEPVLLLGGSWQDNLFNHPVGLEEHLDLLKSVGGNYVRNGRIKGGELKVCGTFYGSSPHQSYAPPIPMSSIRCPTAISIYEKNTCIFSRPGYRPDVHIVSFCSILCQAIV